MAVTDVLYRMHSDHCLPIPGEGKMLLMASSWSEHLRKTGVPAHVVGDIYENSIRTKAASRRRDFAPVISDLLHEWDALLETGFWQKQNMPEADLSLPTLGPGKSPLPGGINTDQGPPGLKALAELTKRTGGGVTCNCPGDKWTSGNWAASLETDSWKKTRWVCAQHKCDFVLDFENTLSFAPIPMPASSPSAAPVTAPLSPEPEYSDASLLEVLSERGGFNILAVSEEKVTAFARFLKTQVPVEDWSNVVAKQFWTAWEKQAAA